MAPPPAAPIPRNPEALRTRAFDLLVIGGGINGTGAAREAARRGLSVALVEREDFGHGTTGRSTRLIHGGLRYLAMYDFGLVRESLVERERLFASAPHLVEPITFLIPFYRGQRTSPWKLKAGLLLYDLLAGPSRAARHAVLSREALLELEPGLRAEGLRGGASYTDGQVAMPERLCVENALDAAAHGAVLLNHAACDEILVEDGVATGARVRDLLTGDTFPVRARRVLNTTGPWVDRVRGLEGKVVSRMTKGVHLVTPPTTRHAVLLFSPDDDRVFFSIPWMGLQLVGTTDTDFVATPDEARAEADDVAYLRRGIRLALPQAPVDVVHYAYAGVRNLVPEAGKKESDVSRKHQVLRHAQDGIRGLWSLVGGKITPYRAVCEAVVAEVAGDLARRPSGTARARLPGAPDDLARLETRLSEAARDLGLPPEIAGTWARTYGRRAHGVLDLVRADGALADVVCPHAPMLLAEVDFVVTSEWARTAADVLLRRARAGWMPCEGRDALPRVLDRLDRLLGRTGPARAADEAAFARELARRHAWEA